MTGGLQFVLKEVPGSISHEEAVARATSSTSIQIIAGLLKDWKYHRFELFPFP